jgi:hypothetical protein
MTSGLDIASKSGKAISIKFDYCDNINMIFDHNGQKVSFTGKIVKDARHGWCLAFGKSNLAPISDETKSQIDAYLAPFKAQAKLDKKAYLKSSEHKHDVLMAKMDRADSDY